MGEASRKTYDKARQWLKDMGHEDAWGLSDDEVFDQIEHNYDGGWPVFARNAM